MAKRQQSTPEYNAAESIISTLWALFTLPFKNKTRGIDAGTANMIASHWDSVIFHLSEPTTEAIAVSEADKLLDAALQALNLQGRTMGDRLRGMENRWGREFSNEVWRAHKLRNQLAHEVGMRLAPGQAKQAINTFEKALRSCGVPL